DVVLMRNFSLRSLRPRRWTTNSAVSVQLFGAASTSGGSKTRVLLLVPLGATGLRWPKASINARAFAASSASPGFGPGLTRTYLAIPGGAVQVGRFGSAFSRHSATRNVQWSSNAPSASQLGSPSTQVCLKLGRSSLPSAGLLKGLMTAHSAMQSADFVPP